MTLIDFIGGPTALQEAPRLAERLGLASQDLFVKRDDLIGLGGGGNKVRKLQYTCTEAVAAGATVLVTTGAPQSNHARLSAAAAAKLGLRAVLVLDGVQPQAELGNVLLERFLGATIVWADGRDPNSVAEEAISMLIAEGERPFLIPFGGTTPQSAQGYADAARELLIQLPDVEHVVVAVGSGGTMAGLVKVLGAERVLGVDSGAVSDARTTVTDLLHAMGVTVEAADLRIDTDQVGHGYEHLGAGTRTAMHLFAETEAILLDPTYTGRAAAGLATAIRTGTIRPGDKTVFLHTGGLPGLFAHPEI